MSRSLRHTHTRAGRKTTSGARTMQLGRKTPAGAAEQVGAPSRKAFREYVVSCICPFCGLGPYKALAIHTSKAHGVDGRELRERAGLFYSESITSPEYHQKRSEISKENYEKGVSLRPDNAVKSMGKRRRLSPAAIELQRQKLNRARELDPDLARKASAASREAKAKEMRPIYELVVETYNAVLNDSDKAYGAIAETARRLGWEKSTTRRRIVAAWDLGMGTHDRTVRGSSRDKECQICGGTFTVTRGRGWDNNTCGVTCGKELSRNKRRKPPRTAVCKVCEQEFTYVQPGTKPRTICDDAQCRSELMRRAARSSRSR